VEPPWPHAHLNWPDYSVPADPDALRSALVDLLDRARTGAAVEVGCLGGHGRTGTALACLAVLTGAPASEAVAWVRANYCEKAVETDDQARFVAAFAP
jgi:protein-tyrosine phosphatase